MLKQKRTHESRFPLYAARGFLVVSLLYTTLASLQSPFLKDLYEPIAGFMLTFFWPVVVFSAFLGLLAVDYRLKGFPLKARATKLVLLAIAIFSAGAVAALRTLLA